MLCFVGAGVYLVRLLDNTSCPSMKLHPQESQEKIDKDQNVLDWLQRKRSFLKVYSSYLIIFAFSLLAIGTNVDKGFEKQKAQREAIHQFKLEQSENCESRWRVEHILRDQHSSSSNHLDLRISISIDSRLVFGAILGLVSQTSLAMGPGWVCIL